MKLYLVQHGEALAKEIDPDRPLSESGRADVRRMADFLAASGIRVARVWHSGKARAAQTAELLGATLAPGVPVESVANLSPNDPTGPLIEAAAGWAEDTLVAGHLPFMAKCVARLAAGDGAAALVGFRPGSVVCLERDDGGAWAIAWMMRPDLLRDR